MGFYTFDQTSKLLAMNETHWQAVKTRDSNMDNVFVYAVKSTGIYCQPSCSSRQPNQKNVEFFDFLDILPKNYEDRSKNPFAKSSFKRYNVNMDLSKMNKVGEENSSISNTSGMLNINELNYTLDSLKTDMKNEIVSFSDNINSQTGIQISQQIDTTFNKTKKIPQKF